MHHAHAMPPCPEPDISLRRRRLLQAGLGWVTLAWGPSVGAQQTGASTARDLRILHLPEFQAGRAAVQALRVRFPGAQAESDPSVFEARKAPPLYVSVGPGALKRALGAELKAPLISLFTAHQTWRQLTGADLRERSPFQSALHAEASSAAQLQLAATLFERRVSVAVVLSEASAHLEKPLKQAAAAWGVDLLLERGVSAGELVRALNRIGHAQALLAVPDATLYNPDTLRAVLESTYRRGMPVLGFSAATVAAGTLGSALCTVEDVVADLAELIDSLPPQPLPTLPEPRSPRYWRVSINESVARSLGIQLSDKVLNLGNAAPARRA